MAEKKKKTPEFKAWHKRRWLNSAKRGGAAFINMAVEEISKECDYAYVSGTVSIADCSRIVTLEFYSDGDDEKLSEEAMMAKIDVFMISFGQFRGKLQLAIDAAKKSKADAKKKEKSSKDWEA